MQKSLNMLLVLLSFQEVGESVKMAKAILKFFDEEVFEKGKYNDK
jgi:hypothetical protein